MSGHFQHGLSAVSTTVACVSSPISFRVIRPVKLPRKSAARAVCTDCCSSSALASASSVNVTSVARCAGIGTSMGQRAVTSASICGACRAPCARKARRCKFSTSRWLSSRKFNGSNGCGLPLSRDFTDSGVSQLLFTHQTVVCRKLLYIQPL
jgi:hypothetical protein